MATENLTDVVPGLEREDAADGIATVLATTDVLLEAARTLRADGFAVLIDIVPVDLYPREPRFEISYLLLRPEGTNRAHLRLKVRVPEDAAQVPSLSGVWPSAGWAEREAYDFFGIHFDGHPDLRRILMPDDWEGFPMRKDYPVQIKDPVKTYEPMQLTAEEFAANVEAARDRAAR